MSDNNEYILLKDSEEHVLSYTAPNNQKREEMLNSLNINKSYFEIIQSLFDYLYSNKKNSFTIEEFSKHEKVTNIEQKKLITIINQILYHLSPNFYFTKKEIISSEELIILKEKKHILLSTFLNKIEHLFHDSFLKKNPLLITINKISNQFDISNKQLEDITLKVDKSNFFTLTQQNTNEKYFFIGFLINNEMFFIIKKILLQTIYQYFFFIERFLFSKDFFADNLLLILRRELGISHEKIKSNLRISEINIYNMLYLLEEDHLIDNLFFLRFYRILIREISLKINNDKQINNDATVLIHKISKLLYFILSSIEKERVSGSIEKAKKKKIEDTIEKYIAINAYQNDKKTLMISLKKVLSIKVDDNNVISDFYTEKELKKIIKKNNNIIALEIKNDTFFIHKFRLLYTYIYMIKRERQYLIKKVRLKKNNNIFNRFFFSEKKKVESFLSKNISNNFIELSNQLKKIIYKKHNKEELLKFIKKDLYKKNMYSQQELSYIESINKSAQIDYVYDLCYNINSIYPFSQMLNIHVF